MMETCAPVSSNTCYPLLLTIKLITHLSPTNIVTDLVSFTLNFVENEYELIILSLCCSCS